MYDCSSLGLLLVKDLFELAKPCKAIEVPLGQVCIDRYKSWYR